MGCIRLGPAAWDVQVVEVLTDNKQIITTYIYIQT